MFQKGKILSSTKRAGVTFSYKIINIVVDTVLALVFTKKINYMVKVTSGLEINPQYITDDTGKKTAVLLPLSDFDALIAALLRAIESDENEKLKKSKISRFRGVLTAEEGDALQQYVKKSREEWL
ncbi:MAG: hypothetical protein HC817_12025 [Saprospiraceae bacterium]|nr:hypothetical protein [Saprospiraceae bacterium]